MVLSIKVCFFKFYSKDSVAIQKSTQHKKQSSFPDNTRLIQSKRNVTKMVVFTSLIFLIGNILVPILYFIFYVLNLKLESYALAITLLSNTLQFGSYGLNAFVFYSFNNKYRLVFRRMFLRKNCENIYGL